MNIAEGDTASDIWVFHLRRGEMSPLTTEPGRDRHPRWSPDGGRIAFEAERLGALGAPTLFVRDVSGERQDVAVWRPPSGTGRSRTLREWSLRDWSRDGRFLLIETSAVATQFDLWVLRPDEAGTQPAPYLQTPFNEAQGRFSPDGRWVAYQSNESGRPEVYVRPFPSADRKWVVSAEGGVLPVWSRDGRELYYVVPGELTLMAAAIAPGDEFRASAPRALFKNSGTVFDVARDGRFLMASPVEPPAGSAARASSPTLVFISDWRAKLGR
jgi:Tol biopolymer transport system component